MTTPTPDPLIVRGGPRTIDVHEQALKLAAASFSEAGGDAAGAAWHLHGYLLDPSVGACAVLDPVGAAHFEITLMQALDGPVGLSLVAMQIVELAELLRVAAYAYEHGDQLAIPDWIRGIPSMVLAIGQASQGRVSAAQHTLTADPRAVDAASTLIGLPGLAQDYASTRPDGRAVLRHRQVDSSIEASRPPRSMHDLLSDLAGRCDDPRHGEIDVRVLTMPDGSRRAVVDISGTKSWDPLPTHDITSLTTNALALNGRESAYSDGVLAALHAAGVGSHDEVMMIGHSEGGMVAVTAARQALRTGQFDVTHVITAGSPIARSVGQLPARVQVLALENIHDVVPHLDGGPNPARRDIVTASAAEGDGTIIGDHDVDESYLPMASLVDASDNPVIRQYLNGAGDFLHAERVVTHTFQVQRR